MQVRAFLWNITALYVWYMNFLYFSPLLNLQNAFDSDILYVKYRKQRNGEVRRRRKNERIFRTYEKTRYGVFARLTAKKIEAEKRGKTVYDLFVGTPDFPCEKHILDAGIKAMSDPENIKYTLLDSPEMINAVIAYYSSRYGVSLTADMIASCNGTQDGMGHVGMLLADRGDDGRLRSGIYSF